VKITKVASVPDKKAVDLLEEDRQLLREIKMAIDKKSERKLTDFLDGN
jgi:accessory colonization factor AcfC